MTGLGDLCLAPIGRLTCVRTRSLRSFCSALRSIRPSKYANESCTDGVSGIALELGQNLAGGLEHMFVQPAGISSAYLIGRKTGSSHLLRQFCRRWQPTVWRQLVNKPGQDLGQLLGDFLLGQA